MCVFFVSIGGNQGKGKGGRRNGEAMWIESYSLGVMEAELSDDLSLLLIIHSQGRMKSVAVAICQGPPQWPWVLLIDLPGVQFPCAKSATGLRGGGGACSTDILSPARPGIPPRSARDRSFLFIISGRAAGSVAMRVLLSSHR